MATKGAPMPKREQQLKDNPMKLYTYLVCLSGLAAYPDNTRIFRQKNLVFTKIESAIHITRETVKLYLYQLELNGLIEYGGDHKFKPFSLDDAIKESKEPIDKETLSKKGEKELLMKYIRKVWNKRTEEKDAYYYIPRPNPYTPLPEETLVYLNEVLKCSELELKLLLLCRGIKEDYDYRGLPTKAWTYEMYRDALNIKGTSSIQNHDILKGLLLMKALGLLDFETGYGINAKGGQIPLYRITATNAYVNIDIDKKMTVENNETWTEICQRIQSIVN